MTKRKTKKWWKTSAFGVPLDWRYMIFDAVLMLVLIELLSC